MLLVANCDCGESDQSLAAHFKQVTMKGASTTTRVLCHDVLESKSVWNAQNSPHSNGQIEEMPRVDLLIEAKPLLDIIPAACSQRI